MNNEKRRKKVAKGMNQRAKEKEFLQIIALIQNAKEEAFLAVNTTLIDLY